MLPMNNSQVPMAESWERPIAFAALVALPDVAKDEGGTCVLDVREAPYDAGLLFVLD
jgi:hypothetical protein